MATSGIVTSYKNSNQATYYVFEWSRTSYSVQDNTSTISWKVSEVTTGYIGVSTTLNYSLNIDGNTYSFSGKASTNKGEVIYKTGTTVISHNAEGTKTFSFSLTRIASGGGSHVWLSGTGTLDPIARPVTITTAPDFNDEENPTITYNNISGNLVTKIEACISFTGGTDNVPYREISKTDSSYTFELTDSERATLWSGIGSGNSRTVRFYVKTTIGNETFWSYLTKTFTLIDYKPTLSPTVTDTNRMTAMLTGDVNKLIRYHSKANVSFGAVAQKGAYIAQRTASNGSQSVSIEDINQDSVVIENIEDNVFTLSATDNRGHSVSEQVHFKGDNFIPYFKVTCNQTIHLNIDNTIALTVTGKYFDGSFGAQENELIVETRYKENNKNWSSWVEITPLVSEISDGNYKLQSTLSGYDPSGTYVFQCRAGDRLSTAHSAEETITLKPLFDWDRYDFNFNIPVSFNGDTMNDFVIETGTEAMGSNGTWYWRKWKSGKAECYGCRNYGSMAVTTAWGGLYRSSTLTQSLPSNLFASTPEVIDISFRGGSNYGGWVASHENSAPNASQTGSFIVVRPASATLSSSYLSLNVIGRWK